MSAGDTLPLLIDKVEDSSMPITQQAKALGLTI